MFIAILDIVIRRNEGQYTDPVLQQIAGFEGEVYISKQARVDVTATNVYFKSTESGVDGIMIVNDEDKAICFAAHTIEEIDSVFEQAGYKIITPKSKKNSRKVKLSE